MFAAGKTVIEPLLVINEKAGALLIRKGRKSRKLAALAFQFHMAANNVRRAYPRFQLLQKIITKLHVIDLEGVSQDCESAHVDKVSPMRLPSFI
jgi:hypothetical protein